MRIIENSPSRLVLREQSVLVSIACFLGIVYLAYLKWAHHVGDNLYVGMAGYAIFGLAFLQASVVTFDKAQRICFLRKLAVIKWTSLSIPFHDITDIVVQVGMGAGTRASLTPGYRLVLTTSEATIPMAAMYGHNRARYDSMQQAILAVLGHSVSAPDDDSVQQLIKQGKLVHAAALLRIHEHLDLTTARERVAEIQKKMNNESVNTSR